MRFIRHKTSLLTAAATTLGLVLGTALPSLAQSYPAQDPNTANYQQLVPFTQTLNDYIVGSMSVVQGGATSPANLWVQGCIAPQAATTGKYAAIAPIPSMVNSEIITIPDAGATSDTFVTVKAPGTISGAVTFSGAVHFTGTPDFSAAHGLVLDGTTYNDTIKALAAQGQASALTVDDVGGATGFIPTLTNAQTVNGALSRADMATTTGTVIWNLLLGTKTLAGIQTPSSATSGTFGINTTATFGSPATLDLISEAANSNTKTDVCEFEVLLPVDYVAGSAISVNVQAEVTGGGTLGSTKSLTCDAFLVSPTTGSVGSNLGPSAGVLVQGTSTPYAFAITPTGLVAGNKLLIQLQTAMSESAGTNITATLFGVNVTTSTQM